jgi:hypothetical protein
MSDMSMAKEARGWRSNLNILHERVCFKHNFLFGMVLLLLSALETGSGVGLFQSTASPPRLSGFEIVGLISILPFFVVLAIEAKCITERIVFLLFSLNVALDLVVRGVALPHKSSVFVIHYYAMSLAMGICTTVSIIAALVVARIKQT